MIDNDVYDRLGDGWWDEHNPLAALHGSMTAGRIRYFRSVLARLHALPAAAAGARALDIGSGGGFLAEEFCRLGFAVTGVDPSEISVRTAQSHAAASHLDIDYRVGSGEQLPVEDAAFDVAYCCDVLEHVADVDRVLAETARVLRPGGVYLFDTPNRTVAAKLATQATQQWPIFRLIDFPAHDWARFVRPAELAARARGHGLAVREIVGLGPHASIPTVIATFVGLHGPNPNYRRASERLDMRQTRSTRFFYAGYALREQSHLVRTEPATLPQLGKDPL